MLRRDWKWSSVSTTRRCKHIFLLCWVQFVQKVPEIGTERFLRINWRNLPESLKVILRTPDQSWFKQLLKLVTNQTWLCLLIEGVFFDNLSQMEKIISVVISWNTPSYMKLSRHQSQKCRISCIALLNGRNNEKQFPKKRCRLKKEKKKYWNLRQSFALCPPSVFAAPMARIERKYCLISTSYLTELCTNKNTLWCLA